MSSRSRNRAGRGTSKGGKVGRGAGRGGSKKRNKEELEEYVPGKEDSDDDDDDDDDDDMTNGTNRKKVKVNEGKEQLPVKSKFENDKPLENLPDHVELKLKPCVSLMFKDIKFFSSWWTVDKTPKVMDYMFHRIGLKNKDDIEEGKKRAQLWICMTKWLFKEISKMRSNKIAAFHNMVKSK